jgi:hypothetical protein
MSDNILDILTEDLSGIDTNIPVLREGLYDLAIVKVTRDPSKDGTKENLNIQLKTTETASSTAGQIVQAGWSIFDCISISPTERYTIDQIKRNVAAFVQASGCRTVEPVDQFTGKIVRAKVAAVPERKDPKTGQVYPPRNEVKAYTTK